MDYNERIAQLKEILDRKCNLTQDLEPAEMHEIDFEIGQLYTKGDGHEYPVKG